MNSIKKMSLVPQAMMERFMESQRDQQQLVTDSPVQQLTLLDQKLQEVLNSNLSSDIKAKEYSQVLQRYSTIRSKEVRPSHSPVVESPEKHAPKGISPLSGIPPRYINKAKIMMDSIDQNPDLQWNDKNELLYKSELIPGSNLVDLVHSFVKENSNNKPTGWKEFGKALLDQNVPRTAINNKTLWRQVQEPLAVTPEPATTSQVPQSTPRRRTRVVRQTKQQWSPY